MEIDNLPIEFLENEKLGDMIDEITDMEHCLKSLEAGFQHDDLLDLIIERHADFWIEVEGMRRDMRRERLKKQLKLLRGGKNGSNDP